MQDYCFAKRNGRAYRRPGYKWTAKEICLLGPTTTTVYQGLAGYNVAGHQGYSS